MTVSSIIWLRSFARHVDHYTIYSEYTFIPCNYMYLSLSTMSTANNNKTVNVLWLSNSFIYAKNKYTDKIEQNINPYQACDISVKRKHRNARPGQSDSEKQTLCRPSTVRAENTFHRTNFHPVNLSRVESSHSIFNSIVWSVCLMFVCIVYTTHHQQCKVSIGEPGENAIHACVLLYAHKAHSLILTNTKC